jgi:hypothetical protein
MGQYSIQIHLPHFFAVVYNKSSTNGHLFLRIASELRDMTDDVAVCLGIFCIANAVALWLAVSKAAESHGTSSPLAKQKQLHQATVKFP